MKKEKRIWKQGNHYKALIRVKDTGYMGQAKTPELAVMQALELIKLKREGQA